MTMSGKAKSNNHHTLRNMEMKMIQQLVAKAADIIAPVWPLKTFIAVNPLQGLESLPFEKAILIAEEQRYAKDQGSKEMEAVNREVIKWCSIFFDDGQAAISMPDRHLGFYRAFASLAPFDRRLQLSKAASLLLTSLPNCPEEAIQISFEKLSIFEEQRQEDLIRQSLAALPGWAGYVKWRESSHNRGKGVDRPTTLVDYVAVRLILTCLLYSKAPSLEKPIIPMPAYLAKLPLSEERYRKVLLKPLLSEARRMIVSTQRRRPDAQLVFCIDVRSEPFRRAIESQGDYETFGFAGFFGLPVRVRGPDDRDSHDSCPVLVRPRHEVREHFLCTDLARLRRHDKATKLLSLPASFYHWLKYNFTTPFALVEIVGPWFGLRMVAQTFIPSIFSKLTSLVRALLMPPLPMEPDLGEISTSEQVDFAESALRMMGMTEQYSPLVVLCGHGSSTMNNGYASALDCGACGGNHGGVNSRIFAAILNSQAIRSILVDRGIIIPHDTLFLGAEHNTTTDEFELFTPPNINRDYQSCIERLRCDLAQAGAYNAQIRMQSLQSRTLPLDSASAAAKRRSFDWAQVRPEWGLARNAAFIVGPRELTRNINLEARCFLHSYDWQRDRDGQFLENILTAPMVVAQWINHQYLFSTLDNIAYGSGSKVTKNITGKIGVMQGNASDLMHGLPLQSVYLTDKSPYHEPMRLLTVVYAPCPIVTMVVQRAPILKQLFNNGWVTLTVIDPRDGRNFLYGRNEVWHSEE